MRSQKIDGPSIVLVHRINDREIGSDHLYRKGIPAVRVIGYERQRVGIHNPLAADSYNQPDVDQSSSKPISPYRQFGKENARADRQSYKADSPKFDDVPTILVAQRIDDDQGQR